MAIVRKSRVLGAALAVALLAAIPTAVASAQEPPLLGESFDGLTLSPAVSENIPPTVLGFTQVPPVGWEIRNAPGMPQGRPEWQGWSFTTPQFWTAADRQGRENFTRGDGVIAVADPDEWDDVGSPSSRGSFDSSLLTPPVALAEGTRQVTVAFDSDYQQFDDQTAQVLAQFGDAAGAPLGAPAELLRYGSGSPDARDQRVSVSAPAPEGARSVRVTFQLSDAGNDWYWAIDDVAVTARVAGPLPPVVEPTVPPAAPAGVSREKVLVIGVDGLDADTAAGLPGLRGTVRESTLYGPPLSAPTPESGWASLATGVWPDRHRVQGSDPGLGDLTTFPDLLTRLETVRPELSTVALVDRPSLTLARDGEKPVFDRVDLKQTWDGPRFGFASRDGAVVAATENLLRFGSPDAVVVQLGQLAQPGGDPAAVGGLLTRLQRAVDARRGERWLVLVASPSAAGLRGFVLENPAGRSNAVPPQLVDVAATGLAHLGVRPAGLDGRPRQDVPRETFDAARRVPQGWRAASTADCAGFAATTREAWSGRGVDVGRANAVRLAGWFVAADRGTCAPDAGRTSEIVSAPYRVTGATTTVRFTHDLVAVPGQLARVTVSLDGGAPIEVASYTGPVSATRAEIPIGLPAGTRTVAVRWQLFGATGDGRWAIDAPSVGG